MGLGGTRCFNARGRGDRRHDDVGVAHRICCGTRATYAAPLAGPPQLIALRLRKQDIPGRHPLDARLAQARGDRLAGFTEADEGDGWTAIGHRCDSS